MTFECKHVGFTIKQSQGSTGPHTHNTSRKSTLNQIPYHALKTPASTVNTTATYHHNSRVAAGREAAEIQVVGFSGPAEFAAALEQVSAGLVRARLVPMHTEKNTLRRFTIKSCATNNLKDVSIYQAEGV